MPLSVAAAFNLCSNGAPNIGVCKLAWLDSLQAYFQNRIYF